MTPELRRALEICINAAMAEADSLAEVARHSAAEVQAFIDGGKA